MENENSAPNGEPMRGWSNTKGDSCGPRAFSFSFAGSVRFPLFEKSADESLKKINFTILDYALYDEDGQGDEGDPGRLQIQSDADSVDQHKAFVDQLLIGNFGSG